MNCPICEKEMFNHRATIMECPMSHYRCFEQDFSRSKTLSWTEVRLGDYRYLAYPEGRYVAGKIKPGQRAYVEFLYRDTYSPPNNVNPVMEFDEIMPPIEALNLLQRINKNSFMR